jgi:hypothetical protein
MTLFQIMDTHPFASGLAIGMMVTFGAILISAWFVKLLLRLRNNPGLATPTAAPKEKPLPYPQLKG